MSRKERERLVVFGRIKAGELTRKQAAGVLGLSLRQVHRAYGRYGRKGDCGLAHRSRGRPSPGRLDAGDAERAMALYRSTYQGFGPTLLAEKLAERDGIFLSHDTARRLLKDEGRCDWGRKGRRSRRRRERKACFGRMVRMDGSSHAWFEDRGSGSALRAVDGDRRRHGPSSGRVLQLEAPGRLRRVEVWEHVDGSVTVVGGGRRIGHGELDPPAVATMREAKRRAKRKRPIVNNKPCKPGPHQQIRLPGSWPRRTAVAMAVAVAVAVASPTGGE